MSAPTDRSSGVNSEDVSAAVQKGIQKLASLQASDGSWPGWNLAGPQFSAQWIIGKRHFGDLDPDDERVITAWILEQQRADGGFPASFDAEFSDLPTSVLIRCATNALLPAETQAQLDGYIERQGGFAAADPVTLIFACIAGMFPAADLGSWSLAGRLIPGFDRFMGRRVAAVPGFTANVIPIVVQYLQKGAPLGGGFHPIKALEFASASKYLTQHQNAGGSFAGIITTTLLGAVALEGLGFTREDPPLANALKQIDHNKVVSGAYAESRQIVPYTAENWNTAAAVKTLLKVRQVEGGKGSAALAFEYDAAILKGIQYLLGQQSSGVPVDWLNPAPGAPLGGGFAYGLGNEHGSDCDTSALVLETLEVARKQLDWNGNSELLGEIEKANERGLAWLRAMQNSTGGWPAFTHGLRQKPPGPIFARPVQVSRPTLLSMLQIIFSPPLELGDSGWADLTGRVIGSEAEFGVDHEDPRVANAIQFMSWQLANQPGWWGRWEVNYLTASAYCLSGLARCGYITPEKLAIVPSSLDWVAGVAGWIERSQNEDGGWGETTLSYQVPGLAGVGDSTTGITATIVVGFLDIGWRERSATEAGVNFLLRNQLEDGTWGRETDSAVMTPPNQFHTNPLFTECLCLSALVRYQIEVSL